MLMIPDPRVNQRDFLLKISRAITSQLDTGEVLRLVLEASVFMLRGKVGLIALRASDGLFYVRAVMGMDSDQIPILNQQLHDLIIEYDGEPETEAFSDKLYEMAASINSDLRQPVAFPLVFAEQPLGLLIVFRTYRSAATINDLQILQSFADQAAIAVHNAQLYEFIDHERKRLAAILEHSADGVMILNTNLKILSFNRALERMTAWRANEAIGLRQDDVLTWERLEHGDLQNALNNGWPYMFSADTSDQAALYVEGDLLRQDGMTISVGITYAPMLNADGKLANIIANVRDITNFRQAQEMQNTFISVISHELKTPVAIIKGYAATLRRPDANWQQEIIHNAFEVIEDEADRLDALIQNLLTASKLQAQRQMSLEIGDVWLKELAERSVERFSKQTQRHTVQLNLRDNFPIIEGDSARLLQVIDNLVGNAIKYSPDGGVIEVGGEFDERSVSLYVSDSGVGLSPEDQERVFDRFYRVDGKLSRKTQGTGLGLYLSKAIIEAHNGALHVQSHIGKGSTFYFILPRTL